MPLRPLVAVSGLTFGDYLLWNWSLNSNHNAVALLSGLTLPPLALGFLWFLALFLARLVAVTTRTRSRRDARRRPPARQTQDDAKPEQRAHEPAAPDSSGKLAA